MPRSWLASIGAVAIGGCVGTTHVDPAIDCELCDAWNAPQAPFRITANTYYVGTAGLTSVLIDAGGALILIDGGLPQSVPVIDANIRRLGYRTEDIDTILVSHAHFDHVGGIAALVRLSGARVLSSASGAAALRTGRLTAADPQFDPARAESRFPAVPSAQDVADGSEIRVGDVTITAHATPGHTPGGMTWTWTACEGERCRDVVYADSLSPIAADGFRFSDSPAGTELRDSAQRIGALNCDVFLSNHPSFFQMQAKLDSGDPAAFVKAGDCRRYADGAMRRLARRLAEENSD